MKKLEYINAIVEMLSEISKDYDHKIKIPVYLEHVNYEDIKSCYKWVKSIYDGQYNALNYKLDMFNRDNIKRMKNLSIGETFDEIDIVNRLTKELKKAFKTKHEVFTVKYAKEHKINRINEEEMIRIAKMKLANIPCDESLITSLEDDLEEQL